MIKIKLIQILIVAILLISNSYGATKYWLGTDDGNEGDWQIAANWSPSGVPTTSDVIIFDGRSTQDVNDGIAQDETGGVVYNLVHIRSSFTGDIGDVNERFHCAATKIIWEGSGTGYIEVSGPNDTTDITISKLILNNSNADLYLTSQINDINYCNEFDTILVIKGALDIGGNNKDTAVKYLYVSSGLGDMGAMSSTGTMAVVIHEDCERYKATAYKTSIYLQNGTCTSDSAIELVEQYGGTFTYGTDLGASPETGLNIETLRLFLGTFNWRPDDNGNDAYIGRAFLFGGTLDASAATNKDRAKVLGNGAGKDIYIFEKATVKLNNGMGNITIDPNSSLWNFAGTIYTDSGTQLGISY